MGNSLFRKKSIDQLIAATRGKKHSKGNWVRLI